MTRTTTKTAQKPVIKTARKANTRERANRRTRQMKALEPVIPLANRPSRDFAGLQKIERLMSGLSLRAANAYADARAGEGDKYARLAAVGYQESRDIVEHILQSRKILTEKEQEEMITVMNNIKLLNIRIHDYATATKDEAWRREHQEEWNPHPLGEDMQGFFAKAKF